ncbi:MAG: glycosyltransferase family 2 protein [Candidatus Nealsonbacteria bacterium]|nr:glycosyltransferase family 2 protein [Candidatus Nealsonbacteria bacterium]
MSITEIIFWAAGGVYAFSLVGYPLLLGLLGRARPLQRDGSQKTPKVTLIIPAYNEENVIEAKIENVLAMDYPTDRLEVLVASDASSDRTVSIARRYENDGFRVLAFGQRRGKAAVLNDAVEAAAGDVLCLCDANVMFRPDAIKRLLAGLDDPNVGAVSGDVRLASEESNFGEGESCYYGVERALHVGESRIGSMMGVDGGMYVIRRELFQPLPPDTILDDFLTTMRVIRQGKRVIYEPAAVATENGTPLARQEFRRRVRVAAGAMQSLKRRQWPPLTRGVEMFQYVSHKLIRWFGPVWLTAMLVANVLLWNDGVVYRVALVAQAAFYLLAATAGLSLRVRATRLGGIAFYFVMSHVAMAIGLFKGTFDMQRVAWVRTERTALPSEVQRTAAH